MVSVAVFLLFNAWLLFPNFPNFPTHEQNLTPHQPDSAIPRFSVDRTQPNRIHLMTNMV